MAVDADLMLEGGHLDLQLHLDEPRERISDDPPELPDFAPGSTTWLYYDGAALERGEHEFLGIEVSDVAKLSDQDIAAIERLHLPRVNVPQAGLLDASIVDVLRWARAAHRDALGRGEGEVWGTPRSATSPRF